MSEIFITSDEKINAFIKDAVFQAFGIQQEHQIEVPDTCDLVNACEYLNHLGYNVKKSVIYKLSAKNDIPCQRINSRLIFSRKHLKNWFESQLEQNPPYNAALELSKSAQKKIKRG